MEDRTTGAWLVHHAQKIQVTTNQDFDNVAFAGKSAILLSALSTAQQESLTHEKVKSLAKANNISQRTELPAILDELAKQRLIERGESGIDVLGVSSSAVVEHAARIFHESEPAPHERAAIEVAERVSAQPQREADFLADIQDEFELSSGAVKDFLSTSSQIGLFDSEALSPTERIYFNGNLFRKDGVRKVRAALDSISIPERSEPPRILRRLFSLRGLSHEEVEPLFTRGPRTRCSHGAGAPRRVPLAVGCHRIHRPQDRLRAADAQRMGQAR